MNELSFQMKETRDEEALARQDDPPAAVIMEGGETPEEVGQKHSTLQGLNGDDHPQYAKKDMSGVTEKVTPHDNDTVLINDSEASGALKKVKVGNVGGSGLDLPNYMVVDDDGFKVYDSDAKTNLIATLGRVIDEDGEIVYEDKVPIMTSGTIDGVTITDSGVLAGGYESWKAFDDDLDTKWITVGAVGYVMVDFGEGNTAGITKYTLTSREAYLTNSPRDWTLKGSNNGGDWDTLDTQVDEPTWGVHEKREYILAAFADYRYYKLDVTDNQSSNNTSLAEIELIGPQTVVYDYGIIAPNVVPDGGTTGQVLKKVSDDDHDLEWAAEEGGGGGESVVGTLESFSSIPIPLTSGMFSASGLLDADEGCNGIAHSSTDYLGWDYNTDLICDLGAEYNLAEIQAIPYYFDGRKYKDVKIETSVDGVTYSTIFNTVGDCQATEEGYKATFPTGKTARYVKIYMNGSNENDANHLCELIVSQHFSVVGDEIMTYPAYNPDTPPASANTKDDEFDGAALDAKWSWANQGSAAASVGDIDSMLKLTGVSDAWWRGIFQTVPSGDWTAIAKVHYGGNFWSDAYEGILVLPAADGKMEALAIGKDWNVGTKDEIIKLRGEAWDSWTTWGSERELKEYGATVVYLKVEWNDTTGMLRYSISTDGRAYVGLLDWFTPAITPGRFGLAVRGSDLPQYFEFFRVS